MKTIEGQFVDVRTAATMLDVCKVTVWRWIKHGDLRCIKSPMGKKIRIPKEDIEALMTPVELEPNERLSTPMIRKQRQKRAIEKLVAMGILKPETQTPTT